MKKLIYLIILVVMLGGCGTLGKDVKDQTVSHKVEIEIKGIDKEKAVIQVKQGNRVHRSMEVRYEGYKLSVLSAVYENKLYIKLFSGLSTVDVTRIWNDFIVIENEYPKVDEVHLYINSPGGDAFAGLALADQIEKFQKKGYKFIAKATGIVASAAVPVFAVCDDTYATEATIFMVHEAALWKWPGRETASDIRSQGKLMDLLQKLYITKLTKNSNLEFDDWCLLEAKTSWFSVKKAQEFGILDHIE